MFLPLAQADPFVTIDAFVPILHSLFWCLVFLVFFWCFRKRITSIANIVEQRLQGGGSIKFGDIEIGSAFVTKTSDVKGKIQVFGNPDRFKLLVKAEGDDWSNSTKALEVPGGCVVQTTNEHRMADGSWTAAESLTFVPNVVVVDEENGNGRYLTKAPEVTG
jgi:hypothetical protein